MEARGPKGPLTITIDLTPLCQPGSVCRFSKIYLLLLEGGMGIVVLMIVNLFSSLLHLNADFSERGGSLFLLPFPATLRTFFFFGGGAACQVQKALSYSIKMFRKEEDLSLYSLVFQAPRTSHPLKDMRESFSSFSGEREALGEGVKDWGAPGIQVGVL